MCLGIPGIWWRESVEAVTEEGEGAADLFLKGEAGGEGTVDPVSETRRQEEKGKRPRKTAIWLRLCSSAKLQSP